MPFPWVAAAITGGTALANWLSGDDRKEVTRADLEKWGATFMDVGKSKGDLARMISSRIKGRRSGIDARNSQAGLNNPTDVYSNEEDLVNSEQEGMNQIDEAKRREDQAVAMTLAQMNEGYQEESGLSKLFEGALTGAGLGFGVQGILNKGIGEDDKKEPDNKPIQPEVTPTYQSVIGGRRNKMNNNSAGFGDNNIYDEDYFKFLLNR